MRNCIGGSVKGSTPIRPDGTVILRGIKFPAEVIGQAMRETGGTVVSDDSINEALDGAMKYHMATYEKKPEHLIIEAIPATVFIPRRISVRRSRFQVSETLTDLYLYFAKPRMFHA
jgi:hypothetical protein